MFLSPHRFPVVRLLLLQCFPVRLSLFHLLVFVALQLYLFVRSLLTALVVLQSSYAAADRHTVVAVINQAAEETTGKSCGNVDVSSALALVFLSVCS